MPFIRAWDSEVGGGAGKRKAERAGLQAQPPPFQVTSTEGFGLRGLLLLKYLCKPLLSGLELLSIPSDLLPESLEYKNRSPKMSSPVPLLISESSFLVVLADSIFLLCSETI